MAAFDQMKFAIKGVAPCIQHNGRLGNPMDPFAKALKAVTSKKKKSDSDFEEMAHLEFLGGLYVDENGHPCWPGENIESMIQAAARRQKMGKEVKAGLIVNGLFPLIYDGPKDPEELWKTGKHHLLVSVNLRGVKIMRCRPIFRQWDLKFTVDYDPEIINPDHLKGFMQVAASYIGLSEWRPKYGRFQIVSVKG